MVYLQYGNGGCNERSKQTLYIPLYGKALVSRRGIILHDAKAEEIWQEAGFPLKGRAGSVWLCYYMGMRANAFDRWLENRLTHSVNPTVLHIGCGLDSRVLRVDSKACHWYDVDFPEVISERRKYFSENEGYHMISANAAQTAWLDGIAEKGDAMVIMEGFSMYLARERLTDLLSAITRHFCSVSLLVDCYSTLAAKISKYKNPVNEVGVTTVYGIDRPQELCAGTGLCFIAEHELTPKSLVDELLGREKSFFSFMYTGAFARRLYKLYEYECSTEK